MANKKEQKTESKHEAVLPPIKPSAPPDTSQTQPQPPSDPYAPGPVPPPSPDSGVAPADKFSSSGTSPVPSMPDPELPSTKDMLIGAGSLLILSILFFVIRMYFENYLVGPLKKSPSTAGMAGWALFGGLFFGAALGCLAMVAKAYMTMPVIIVLSALSIISFIIAVVVASRK